MQALRFVSRNKFKLAEASKILEPLDVTVSAVEKAIEELQTVDTRALVRDKALRAFQHVGEPLFVEHTGLYLDHLNGLPGGLTQIFWDTLEADRFAQLFGAEGRNRVIAKTVIGYVDGKKCHFFDGEIAGTVAESPRGSRDFQWDCVFVPEGHTQTFAEMGEEKTISPCGDRRWVNSRSSFEKGELDSVAIYARHSGSRSASHLVCWRWCLHESWPSWIPRACVAYWRGTWV